MKNEQNTMRPEEWIISRDTGISSKTIWAVMMGLEYHDPCTPSDPEDFGRCFRLLQNFPQWKKRLNEVSAKHPKWKSLIENWNKLEKLFIKEGSEDSSNRNHPELYHLMKNIMGHKLYGVPLKKTLRRSNIKRLPRK